MQIHGILPFNVKAMAARKIKSLAGQVPEIDQSRGRDCIGRFLWVRIRMDISLLLMRGIFVGFPEERARWVDFRYESLLEYCSHCGCLGHLMSSIRRDDTRRNMESLREEKKVFVGMKALTNL